MEANAWWLLAVPVLFGLGWIAARIDAAQWFTKTRQLPESYFKGLNHLLNEEHELAIASFEEVARLDPETVDLYFALGSLFRRRGETERALRLHRNLLERADLPEAQRQRALFCVAQDYLNAGIFDRAEVTFSSFSSMQNTPYAFQAQRELAKLYEKENHWAAAITCLQLCLDAPAANTQNPIDRSKIQEDLSHYACEWAVQHIELSAYADAHEALTLAADNAPQNPRIRLLLAQLNLLTGHAGQAYQQLDHAVAQDEKLAAIAIHCALSYSVDKAAGLAAALRWAKGHPSADTIRPLFNALNKTGSAEDALAALALLRSLAKQLKHPPQQLASAHLLLTHLDVLTGAKDEQQSAAMLAQPALNAIESVLARYDKPTCAQCGFKASRHHWRCPGCARWNTLPYSAASA